MFIKLFFISFIVTLQGCSFTTYDHGEEIEGLKLKSPMPNYSVNDIFVFTNKYIERVSAISGDIIEWEVAGGTYSYKAHKNFTLPKISWETMTKIGDNDFQATNKNILWPLTPGDDYITNIKKSISKKKVRWSNRFWFQSWQCETNDPRRIVVPSGSYNTIPITCILKSSQGNTIRTNTWYYSPAVGHYVKKVVKTPASGYRPSRTKEYELTGYILAFSGLSKEETTSSEDHLQASLEKLPSGSESTWESEDMRTTRTISIMGTFSTKGGNFCRNVAFKVASPKQTKSYTAIFCRDQEEWKIALVI